MTVRVTDVLVGVLAVSLVLGATPIEVANGLVVLAAIARLATDPTARARAVSEPVLTALAPIAALLFGLFAFVDRPAFDTIATIKAAWAFSTAPALAVLVRSDHQSDRPVLIGLAAAAVAGAGAVVQGAWGVLTTGAPAGWGEPSGLFSHHLTLGYALGPAALVALSRPDRSRWLAVPLALGVLACHGEGPVLALIVGAVALGIGRVTAGRLDRRASLGLVAGTVALAVAAALAVMRASPYADEVHRRALLWTGGAELAARGGVPAGSWRTAVAPVQRSLDPTFEFPHHAHDDAIQRLATAGPWGWVAVAAAVALAVEAGGVALALVAWGVIGGLTQDLLGDLEVLRALLVWTALGALGTPSAPRRQEDP